MKAKHEENWERFQELHDPKRARREAGPIDPELMETKLLIDINEYFKGPETPSRRSKPRNPPAVGSRKHKSFMSQKERNEINAAKGGSRKTRKARKTRKSRK